MKYNADGNIATNFVDAPAVEIVEPTETEEVSVYNESPEEFNYMTLQRNLDNCLTIVDYEVMKNYIPSLQHCPVVPITEEALNKIKETPIQFFRISELVYQEDEFSVHKLATVFNALSNKPCTLVLMIKSDGQNNNFYLGVRSRNPTLFDTGTMKTLLEQSLLGQFPGSDTDEYLDSTLESDMNNLNVGCVSSVTCIADFKQEKESFENKDFIQGLEKFIYSMEGKPFTAICIANNLEHSDLVETRKEYEKIYTLMSPFANMQYNYTLNNSSSVSDSDTEGNTETKTTGVTQGVNTNVSGSLAQTEGEGSSQSLTATEGQNVSVGEGKSHTVGTSDGVNDSETTTTTVGTFVSTGKSTSVGIGFDGIGISSGTSVNAGVSSSVSRGKTHGTSHTDSISDSISKNLTVGINSSTAIGNTLSQNRSSTQTLTEGLGAQYSENEARSLATNFAHTKALTDTFGSSQAVTLNVQNKSLINTLDRLEKQLERLDECESIGMWDFAAYFLAESAAEAETAASMYRSLISGNQSGLEVTAVNTWTEEDSVGELTKYITSFIHPIFLYQFAEKSVNRQTYVDATALASTNELSIQLGLPRKSVKGLPVIEHALFAREVLKHSNKASEEKTIQLGVVSNLGQETDTVVELDLKSLSMHTFITGSTGSGKSNTVYELIKQCNKHGVHFMVIEPAKGEYKNVFGHGDFDVKILGTNPQCSELLKINPFKFPKKIHVLEHIDRLIEIFNVCWPMYAAMPAVLKDAVLKSYESCGWDLVNSKNKISEDMFPTFVDLQTELVNVIEGSAYSTEVKSNYMGSLLTRVKSLTNGLNGQIFGANEIPNDELFDKNVIIDLSRTGSLETKSLIMGILVMRLNEHRMSTAKGMNNPLKHITVLEEAHNILKRTSTEQSSEGSNMTGKSVEMISNAIAEMRTYGEGFIIADQSPNAVDISAIRNTNTKIIMRLPDENDRHLAGKAAALKDEQIDEIAKLPLGAAVVYQNDWIEPVLCQINPFEGSEEEYEYSPVESDVVDEKVFNENLIQLLLKGRTVAKSEPNIELLKENIQFANIPTRDKLGILNLINEYVDNGTLRIWDDSKFDRLACLVTRLMTNDFIISNLVITSSNFEKLTIRFIEEIKNKVTSLSDELMISICQCFMKAYSLKGDEEFKIYSKWKKETIKNGVSI